MGCIVGPTCGIAEMASSHLHPSFGSTTPAIPASTKVPIVQKDSMMTSHLPRFADGRNSMKRVKATGTPPKPIPTWKHQLLRVP